MSLPQGWRLALAAGPCVEAIPQQRGSAMGLCAFPPYLGFCFPYQNRALSSQT